MLQRTDTVRLKAYIARKRQFDRRRRTLRLDFDALYAFFSSAESGAQIARRARVSKERVNLIYNKYFSDLFGMTGLERQRNIERKLREGAEQLRARDIGRDRVLVAVRSSAEKARPKREIQPVFREKHAIGEVLSQSLAG